MRIFFRALSNKTFNNKAQKMCRRATDQRWMWAQENLVISKPWKPKVSDMINANKLAAIRKYNCKVCITSELMEEQLHDFEKNGGKWRYEHSCCFCITHAPVRKNIKLVLLPPNCPLIIKPSDQGIIVGKPFIERFLVKIFPQTINKAQNHSKTFAVLDLIYFIRIPGRGL